MGKNTHLEKVIFAALLTSMAIVIKIIFNYIPLPTTIKNIDLFIVFIVLAGILMGPLYGGFVGLVTDIAYIFIAGGNWGLFTVAHIVAGLIPGLVYYVIKYKKYNFLVTFLITDITYFTITTIALDLYDIIPFTIETVIPRLIRSSIVFVPYFFIIHFLVTDKRFAGFSVYDTFNKRHKRNEELKLE